MRDKLLTVLIVLAIIVLLQITGIWVLPAGALAIFLAWATSSSQALLLVGLAIVTLWAIVILEK